MSPRFFAWIAQHAIEDHMRLQMAALSLLAVALYFSIRQWPTRVRNYGKALIIVSGVVIYASIFAFALFTVGVVMGLGW